MGTPDLRRCRAEIAEVGTANAVTCGDALLPLTDYHEALANLVSGLERIGAAGPGRIGWNASPSFDASVQQWCRLALGDTVVPIEETVRQDPDSLVECVLEQS